MKSRTSFFNAAVLRKDITRFAPVWGLYLTGMLLLALTFFTEENYQLAEILGVSIGIFSLVNFCYALVCGAVLFGDLFNSRLCNALHAMPMRREGWFVTHLVSGVLFSVVPNLAVGLCFMPRLGVYWYVALVWVGGMTATYLFFFGAAVLAALCTGSRFAQTLVYGLINFLSILVMWVVQYLYIPLQYGLEIDYPPFVFLSPVCYLCSNELNYVNFLDKIYGYYDPANGWPYTLGIAAVGIVMLIGALLLYRKRHLESAGDFITVRFLSPVFLVLYTMATGMALFLFSSVFAVDRDYLFLAVGIIAGFITGKMLLKRTVKVFKPATFLGLAVMMAVLFGSLGLAKLDVLGLVRWMPEQERVRSVTVHSLEDTYNRYAHTATDEAEIRELMEIHREFIEGQNTDAPIWYNSVYLTYTLDNGRTVTRRYRLDYEDPAALRMAPWLSKPEFVLHTNDVENLINKVNYIEVELYYDKFYNDTAIEPFEIVVGADARALLEAIVADCEAGRMVQDYGYYEIYFDNSPTIGYIRINVGGDGDIAIDIRESAVLTCGWLKDHLAE